METVISGGKIIMENRKLLHVDEEALIEELQAMTQDFKDAFEKTKIMNAPLLDPVDKIYNKCVEQYKDNKCNLFV